MELTTRRAVILIPRVVNTENTSADHLANVDSAMQASDSSFSDDPDANAIIKQEPRLPTDGSTLLSREQSTNNFDTEGGDAPMKEPLISGDSTASALKQEQVEEHYMDDNSANEEDTIVKQEEQLSSMGEEEGLLIKREEQANIINTESITKQANDDERDNDDDSNANDPESMANQDNVTVDEDDEDMMAKHEEVEVGKGEIILHQDASEETPIDDNNQGYIYQCVKCSHRTTDFMSLIKHRQIIHSGRRYKGSSIKYLQLNPILDDPNHYCRACERKFPTTGYYANHLRIVHYISKSAEHATSSTARKKRSTLATARVSNEAGQLSTTNDPQRPKFKCRFCSKRFASMLALTRHQINDHNKRRNGKKARCIDCNMHYRSNREFTLHKRLVHNPKAKKTLAAVANMDNYMPIADASATPITASKTPGSRITCKVCGIGFRTIQAHLSHFNSVHRDYTKKASKKSGMKDVESTIINTQRQPLPKPRTRRKDKAKNVRFLLPSSDTSSTTVTFRCHECVIDFNTRSDLVRHRWSVHRGSMNRDRSYQEKDLQHASITTAQYCCRICLVQCESRSALKHHISTVHNKFAYSSLRKKRVKRRLSIRRKTNLHCRSCSTEWNGRSALTRHLWAAHPESMQKAKDQLAGDGIQTTEELQVGDGNTSMQNNRSNQCRFCQKNYKNWPSCRTHMYSKHRDSITKKKNSPQSSTDATPSSTHLKTSASVDNSPLPDSHLQAAHSNYYPDPSPQQQPTAKKRAAVLDVDDPNNYCTLCDCTFESQGTFHQHLRSKHHIKRRLNTSPIISTTSNHSSDASLSKGTHLCTICQQRQATLGHHRQHLRLVHEVKLPPISKEVSQFRYPDEFIDVNSPDLYCAQCDHYFNTKMFFEKHVEGVHRMSLSA